jgi:hypothetical protein
VRRGALCVHVLLLVSPHQQRQVSTELPFAVLQSVGVLQIMQAPDLLGTKGLSACCVCYCCRSTFLGSRALAGTLLKHKQLSARGPDGLSLEELLKSTGVQRPAEAVAAIALDPKKVCLTPGQVCLTLV